MDRWLPPSARSHGTPGGPSTHGVSPARRSIGRTLNGPLDSKSTSEQAQTRRELTELQKEFNALSKQHQKATARVEEFRDELKSQRLAVENKDKEIALLRRQSTRLTSERDALDAASASDKAYSRKLEAKIGANPGALDWQEKHQQVKMRMAEQRDELLATQEKLAKSEQEVAHQIDEVKSLQHALELRAEDLSKDGGSEVAPRLLYAVAKGREDSLALAMQLNDRNAQVKALETTQAALQAEIEELKYMKERTSEELLALESKLMETTAMCTRFEAESLKAQEDAGTAQRTQQGLESEHKAALAVLDEERSRCNELMQAIARAEREHSVQLEAVRTEAEAQVQQEVARGNEERSMANTKLGEARRQSAMLQTEAQHFRNAEANAQANGQRQLEGERQKVKEAEDQLRACASRQQELMEEVANLHSEIESFTEVNDQFQNELSMAQQAAQDEAKRAEHAKQQMSSMEGQVLVLRSERAATETALKHKVEESLQEYQMVLEERDQLRMTVNEAQSRATSSASTHDVLFKEVSQLKDVNASLSQSKALLQKTMLEQITAIRAQLDQAQLHNRELESTVQRQQENAERLQALVESERQSSAALTRQYESAHLPKSEYTYSAPPPRSRPPSPYVAPSSEPLAPARPPSPYVAPSSEPLAPAPSSRDIPRHQGASADSSMYAMLQQQPPPSSQRSYANAGATYPTVGTAGSGGYGGYGGYTTGGYRGAPASGSSSGAGSAAAAAAAVMDRAPHSFGGVRTTGAGAASGFGGVMSPGGDEPQLRGGYTQGSAPTSSGEALRVPPLEAKDENRHMSSPYLDPHPPGVPRPASSSATSMGLSSDYGVGDNKYMDTKVHGVGTQPSREQRTTWGGMEANVPPSTIADAVLRDRASGMLSPTLSELANLDDL
ncbi:hypothetical protein CYMTET_56104 [Cymbomonas tetramitiformis]|uniref:Uncharacterized protein n=1 Tax=Cymbomonas tetramitiformis TaxID=36881 RepID=A0AAE0BBK7_9CHLO|nr:hypothetical protein CYMTET_56104 [Cymbomonas tetramitiformis]